VLQCWTKEKNMKKKKGLQQSKRKVVGEKQKSSHIKKIGLCEKKIQRKEKLFYKLKKCLE
jgi:hypothetical protein